MILCKKQGMGLPGTGVISGMREVWEHFFAENDLWFMVLDRNEQSQHETGWILMSFGVMLILGARISS